MGLDQRRRHVLDVLEHLGRDGDVEARVGDGERQGVARLEVRRCSITSGVM
jgi:hypothetical protein